MPAPQSKPQTIADTLAAATTRLDRAGVADPRLNAELMLAELLGLDRGGLYVRREETLDAASATRYAEWVERRAGRAPLQHVVGTQEFYGREFRSDGRALVPRPETEGLIDAVLRLDLPRAARVVDLGTGSGCIAITLAVERPDLEVDALELSPDALELARENAALHGVDDRIRFTRGDQTEPPAEWRRAMHAVVCNPPYARDEEWNGLEPEVRDHDPKQAIVAGKTGLEAYRGLVPVAYDLLVPGGHLVLELGFGQSRDVREIVVSSGFEGVTVRPDLAGIDRVLVARRPETS